MNDMINISYAFGELFKKKRIALDLTLRDFCDKNTLDHILISRIECGILPPPQHEELVRYAKCLKIEQNSDDWHRFFNIARSSTEAINDRKNKDVECSILKILPVSPGFKPDGSKFTEKQLDDLIDIIKNG